MNKSRRFTYDVSTRLRQFRSPAGLVVILWILYSYTLNENIANIKFPALLMPLLAAFIASLSGITNTALRYSQIEIDKEGITARAFGIPWRSFEWTVIANIRGVRTQKAGRVTRIIKVCILHKNYANKIVFTKDLGGFYDLIEILNLKSKEFHFDVFDTITRSTGTGQLDETDLVQELQEKSYNPQPSR